MAKVHLPAGGPAEARTFPPPGRRHAARASATTLAAVLVAVLIVTLSLSAPATRAAAASSAPATTEPPGESYHPDIVVPAGAPEMPAVTAEAAVLMDVASGRLLYAKNAHDQRAPASLTKVMTCLLALEAGDLEDTVEVSATASGVGGSSIWLEPGETQTMRDLLYGLMLRSGNDAAEAIAEHIAGNASDFALLMNRRAAEIGASATHFRNPHGLPASGHVTTAADLALITREALLRPDFREIVATRRHVIPWPGQPWDRTVYNENRLLWLYPGADGVKTGWTEEAGRCLIASATRGGWQLLAVVLDAPEMWTDATSLMDWGFSSFRSVEVYSEGAPVTRVRVAGAAERWVPLEVARAVRVAVLPGEEALLRAEPEPPSFVRSPLEAGTEVGKLRLELAGMPLAPVALVSAENVPAGGLLGQFLEDLWVLLRTTLERLIFPLAAEGG